MLTLLIYIIFYINGILAVVVVVAPYSVFHSSMDHHAETLHLRQFCVIYCTEVHIDLHKMFPLSNKDNRCLLCPFLLPFRNV